MDNTNLIELFQQDSQRANKYTLNACGIELDYSKNLINADTQALLLQLAEQSDLKTQIDAMFAGTPTHCFEKACGLANLYKYEELLKNRLVADYFDINEMAKQVSELINNKEVYDKVVKEAYFIKNYGAMNIKKTIYVKNRLMNLIIL